MTFYKNYDVSNDKTILTTHEGIDVKVRNVPAGQTEQRACYYPEEGTS